MEREHNMMKFNKKIVLYERFLEVLKQINTVHLNTLLNNPGHFVSVFNLVTIMTIVLCNKTNEWGSFIFVG